MSTTLSLNTQAAALLPPPAAINEKSRSNRWLIAVAGSFVIIVAGLIGGLLYYFLSQTSKVPRASSDSPTVSQPTVGFHHLGCFHDQSAHALPISVANSSNVQNCFSYAQLNGYSYFGLEDGNECYVGNTNFAVYGDINSAVAVAAFASTNCESRCADGSDGPCGGKWSLSVYRVPGVAVKCTQAEYASTASADGNLVCVPCGANSESQGGQSSKCTCTTGYKNWIPGIGCSM